MGVSSLMRLRTWRFLGLVLVVTWLCMCPSVSAAGSLSGSAGTDPSTPSNSPPPPTTTPPPPTTTPPTTPPSPPTTTPPPTTTAPPTTTPPTTAPPTTTPPATAPTTPSTTPLTPEAGVPDTTAPPTTPTPTTTAPTTTAPVPSTTAPTASPNASPTPTTTPKSGSVSRSITPEAGNQDAQPNSAPESTSAPSSSSGQSYMGIIIAVGVVAIVVLLALFYVAKRHKNRKDDQDLEQMAQLDLELGDSAYAMVSGHQADEVPKENINSHNSYNSYNSHDKAEYRGSREVFSRSPASWSSSRTTAAGSGSESEPLSSIWKNPEILAARIPYEKIRVRDLISRGGFGEVYEGVYHGERVAVKRLLSENRRRLACLEEFMKEAQLLATLEHERIVSFVGVAWDSPRDLCVVLEFMSNGDLRSILAEWRELGRKTGWADVRKVRIALHVAEALTYLHTLNPKIVHRDLKSKNVLVNEHWDAKLSDFGVSREESTHNTMTSNVGSSLWIAPEVMMGNNYDEKADIFSFGVVLSELDSLQLPYHNVLTPDGRKVPDAALLHMVTLGKIQAEFSSMSRTDIVLLGRACLSLDPAMRPSAGEVRYRLSQILSTY